MNYLLSPLENELCKECVDLLHHSQRADFEVEAAAAPLGHRIHHKNGTSFFAAADSGCRICNILFMHHVRTQGTSDIEFYTSWLRGDFSLTRTAIAITVLHHAKHWEPRSGYTQIRFDVLPEDHPSYGHLLNTCRSSPLNEFTGDPAVIELAAHWLSRCTARASG